MSKHTKNLKLPFHAQAGGFIANNEGDIIVYPRGGNHIERAELIVKACNCHADLLEACKRTKHFLEVCHRPSIGRNAKIKMLEAAIKKSESR